MPMRVSLNWLSDHLDLTQHSTHQLADLLTFAGIEVEGIETRGVRSDKIVVAQVSSFEPHPNADRLRLCQVDDGSGQPRQIVCGAKNFVAGDKVPLALPGAVMPGNFEIKESKLRGVLSQGMMCSGRELGLSQDYFARIFRRSMGLSPRAWLVDERIRCAAASLLESDAPIGTVAADHGYADLTLFGRQFRAVMGAAPRQWREQHRTYDAREVG